MKQSISLPLVVLILAGFAWRVVGLDAQSLWRDEVDAIYFATRTLDDTLAMFVQAGQNGPLYFLALRPWFSLVGTSEFALRFPSALAGTLALPLLWQVARRLIPSPLASSVPSAEMAGDPPGDNSVAPTESVNLWSVPLLATLFFAVNPYQLWYAQEGKMYAAITCLVLAASWYWWQGIVHGGWRWWFAYWLVATVALYTHLLIILLFPLHLLWFVVAWPRSRRRWRGYGLALAGLTLPYLPMVWWQWDLLTAGRKMTGFHFVPLAEVAQTILLNQTRGFMPPGDLIWLAPIFFAGAAGLVLGMGEIGDGTGTRGVMLAPWRRYLLLIAWVLGPVAGIHLLSLRQPIFTDRYIIWIAPALMMLLALGVRAVLHHAAGLSRPIALLLTAYIVAFSLFAGWQQKTLTIKYDLRSGVAFVAAQRHGDALLILQIPHMEYAFRYYTSNFGARPFVDSESRLTPWLPGLWTNNGFPDDQAAQEVDRLMQQSTQNYEDVWLLRSEVQMWDQRQLMDRWLEENGQLVDSADFHGVQVRHYVLDGQARSDLDPGGS